MLNIIHLNDHALFSVAKRTKNQRFSDVDWTFRILGNNINSENEITVRNWKHQTMLPAHCGSKIKLFYLFYYMLFYFTLFCFINAVVVFFLRSFISWYPKIHAQTEEQNSCKRDRFLLDRLRLFLFCERGMQYSFLTYNLITSTFSQIGYWHNVGHVKPYLFVSRSFTRPRTSVS